MLELGQLHGRCASLSILFPYLSNLSPSLSVLLCDMLEVVLNVTLIGASQSLQLVRPEKNVFHLGSKKRGQAKLLPTSQKIKTEKLYKAIFLESCLPREKMGWLAKSICLASEDYAFPQVRVG